MQVTDNVIFITGGGSGIGRGLAQAFHKLGNQVIVAGRRAAALDAFISETMAQLATEAPEIVVGDAATLRNNARPKEHALIHGFNAQMAPLFGG